MMPGSDTVHGADAFARDLVPASLRERPHWVCWRYVIRKGKKTKCPFNAKNGQHASTADPSTWSSFDEAVAAWKRNEECAGVGFVFSADDPFTGIDLDECLDKHGKLVDEARQVVESLNSYTEVSPSGRGVKIFIEGKKPVGSRSRSKRVVGFKEIEIYSEKRFFTVTGRRVAGTPPEIADRQPEFDELCHRLWPKKRSAVAGNAGEAGFNGDDDALIEKAKAASNGDRFRGLWSGDTSAHGNDHSAADMGLCSHLAFWTGRNPERMDRLFRQSGLYREKWDEQRGERTYGRMTIDAAVAECTEVYQPPRQTRASSNGPAAAATGSVRQLVPLGQRDPKTGRLVLSPQRTLPTAEAYVHEFHHHAEGRTLCSYAGLLLEWRGNRYCEIEDEAVRHSRKPATPQSTWAATLARVPPLPSIGCRYAPPAPAPYRRSLGHRGPRGATWPHHQSQRANLTSTEADS